MCSGISYLPLLFLPQSYVNSYALVLVGYYGHFKDKSIGSY